MPERFTLAHRRSRSKGRVRLTPGVHLEVDSSLGEASTRRYAAARKGRETPTWLTRLRRIKAALNAAETGGPLPLRWRVVLKLDVEDVTSACRCGRTPSRRAAGRGYFPARSFSCERGGHG